MSPGVAITSFERSINFDGEKERNHIYIYDDIKTLHFEKCFLKRI